MYPVEFSPDAEADLKRLDRSIAQLVLRKLRWLSENFDAITPEPLTGDWQGIFKFRVGDYRVLYSFDRTDTVITVFLVRHRREVYKMR